MVYQVLALKWRPSGFGQVVSQDHVTRTLQNAISSNRIANAYLFTGPRGVGKTTTARIFAKALNCKEGPTQNPCNQCVNCKEIASGHSLDVFEIDGASNRGIDEIRNLRENIRYSPGSSKFKIYIIDEVHMLTNEAFNALLKTLEEPPSHVRFIFATTEPHKVPATILSRCQRFDFKRIPLDHIIAQLELICKNENIQADEESLLVVAKKADGSLRDAESLLDQLVSFCGIDIKITDVLEAFNVVSQDLYFDLTDILIQKDIQKGLYFVNELISSGYDINEFLLGLVEHLRNLLFSKATNDGKLLETSENYKERYLEINKNFSQEDLLRMIQIVSDTEFKIKRSPNPRIKLEMCILTLLKLDRSVTISEVINKLRDFGGASTEPNRTFQEIKPVKPTVVREDPPQPEKTEKSSELDQKKSLTNQAPVSSEPEPIEENVNVAEELPQAGVEENPVLTVESFKNKWSDIVENVKKKRLFISVFLKEGKPIRFDQNTLEIGFPKENGFHIDSLQKNKDLLLQAIQELFGISVQIKFVKADMERSVDPNIIEENNKKKDPKKIDPMVKKIIDTFDGELLT